MKYDFAAIEKKWQEKWEQTKPYAAVTGDGQAEVLRPDRVPVSVRRRACTSAIRARYTAHGYHLRAKSACRATTSCIPSAGTPSACRRRTSPSRTTFTRPSSRRRTSSTSTASSRCSVYQLRLGPRRSTPPTRITTSGPSGSSCSCYKHGLAYKNDDARQLVHQLQVRAGQRGGRRAACASAAARRSSARKRASGCSRITEVCRAPDRRSGRSWTTSSASRLSRSNWIGRSTGAEVDFQDHTTGDDITVYTTRADTLFGVTYMVICPGASAARTSGRTRSTTGRGSTPTSEAAARKSDFERSELNKDKTGVRLEGIEAINPVDRQGRSRSSSPTMS